MTYRNNVSFLWTIKSPQRLFDLTKKLPMLVAHSATTHWYKSPPSRQDGVRDWLQSSQIAGTSMIATAIQICEGDMTAVANDGGGGDLHELTSTVCVALLSQGNRVAPG